MVHEWIGQTGHFFVILSFVSALWATWNYYWASQKGELLAGKRWLTLGRLGFGLHSLAVFGVVASLFYIIYNHYFEYHYAWSHSSRSLPVYYMISCFWEGQEGSFLVWIFWQAILGLILMRYAGRWEAPVLAVFAFVQAFLASMILGTVIPGLDLKIGSSPFMLMRDVMVDTPVFALNPDYVPEDGTGLNPLLQNYWMVIHPPTLFLGFALTLVPFAYCIAGLWKKEHGAWIRPALSWTSAAALILGLGILMGAYWAYETLNFGGYWNWDPVENAVYIPWLMLVGGLHLMMVYRKNGTALKAAILFIILMFILILYSTFLTRSGILGNSSVHSFTDLGLSGQLLLYMLAFAALSVALLIREWKHLPSTGEVSAYSREFWIFIGATVLALMALQVLVPTSIPVYNTVASWFGIELNMAPPANPEIFYTKFQLWFAVCLALLSGTAQFFWWQKMDAAKVRKALVMPVVVALIVSLLALILLDVKEPAYLVLLVAAIYAVVSNFFVLLGLKQTNLKLAGGSVAHIGVAMILLGILFSSGYSKVISQNTSGLLYSREFGDEVNQENVLLWLNEPQTMQQYQLVYKGQFYEAFDAPGYIPKQLLNPTEKPDRFLARGDYYHRGRKYFGEGDTVRINPENTYYRVEYTDEKGKKFTLYPRAQVNPQMGFIASPDIFRGIRSDLYTHVSVVPDPEEPIKWSDPEEQKVKIGDRFFINDYVAVLEGLQPLQQVQGLQLGTKDIAVKARIRIFGEQGAEFTAEPIYVLRMEEKTTGNLPAVVNDLALKVGFMAIHPEEDSITLSTSNTQKDYIILKAMEKPLINILWIGTLLLVAGFGIAIVRRTTEYRQLQRKGVE
ncbi:heme lyase CcmF/NrfE family subunit [Cesiribacter andamanensis]|uniref:Cytochrome c-type biogenesis protein CcmF n=1 Tax=Cesiribacter andamanensis AMV16 TaxID=1279009 RepID=M7NMG3_9BACT|nr:cytochrome c biogenesis protein CcsA [Cesiribacter andamanensis]EMR02970.1 Cytochrome c-type biogenesis protein CcmF [Cesiribacter andamanensis AMV16]